MRWFITFQICLSLVVAPALLAGTLTKEYETGNIDMLRMTLLRPREIIVCYLLAVRSFCPADARLVTLSPAAPMG